LKPTNENALEMLKCDSLSRNELLFKFIELLGKLDGECWTIAVNGDWGCGKTFFVKQAKMILDALNPQSKLDEDFRSDIIKSQRMQELSSNIQQLNSMATVYYDAWLNDNHEDPILSLVYATIASTQSDFSETKKRNILKIAGDIATVFTKRNIAAFFQDLQGEDSLKELKDSDYISNLVRDFIDSLIIESGNRLVIFIDELDRCKPDYTIRFLERIKHYFDDERITFVFSVNLLQLQFTVKKCYGTDFDATRYLDKFFDLRCSLPTIDLERYISRRLNFPMDTAFEYICIETAKYFGFTLREVEHYIRLAKIAFKSNFSDYGFVLSRDKVFVANYILPIIIGLQIVNMQDFNDFMLGKNSKPVIDILLKIDADELRDILFAGDGLVPAQIHDMNIGNVTERLTLIYNTIFSQHSFNNESSVRIAGMLFSKETKNFLEASIALFSKFSDYNR